ncbi:MAG: hypothetical protein O3C51_15770, partial [Planctomycetota bacterium]|nr:hypothetical protein [Planctomycetota bacterium]
PAPVTRGARPAPRGAAPTRRQAAAPASTPARKGGVMVAVLATVFLAASVAGVVYHYLQNQG